MAKRFNPFDIYSNEDDIRDRAVKNFSQIRREGKDFPGSHQSNSVLPITINLKVIRGISALLLIGLMILFAKTVYLQLIKGTDLKAAAEDNRIRIETITAPRGVVYDRLGNLLVHNVPNFTLYAVPADLPGEQSERDEVLRKISNVLATNPGEIDQRLKDAPIYSYQPIKIAEYLPYEKALLLNIESSNLPGILFTARATREYLSDLSMSNVLGYIGSLTEEEYAEYQDQGYAYADYIGKTGIEKEYEKELKGTNGKKQVEVDSQGKEKNVLASTNPISGENIILTIDQNLQKLLAEQLLEMMQKLGSPAAAAVALDPRNGEVLALVSAPLYNNNAFVLGLSDEEFKTILNDPHQPLYNRAIAGEYPSGSTIKPIIAAAALQEGIISTNTNVNSVGGIKIGEFFYPDWKAGGHGRTDVKKALAESVNTFFYYIGGGYEDFTGLGVTKITDYLKQFNLGQQTGIDLPGESRGMVPDKETREATGREWYLGDTYHLSIGQGDILVTPLQVALFTATIANGGTIYRPHLTKTFTDPAGGQTQTIPSQIIADKFINTNHLNTVRGGLRQAVESGSARGLAGLKVAAAGKTGTAEFGKEGKAHAWFTCFAPYDSPEIVLTIIIEEGSEGSNTALPIARTILNWYFSQS